MSGKSVRFSFIDFMSQNLIDLPMRSLRYMNQISCSCHIQHQQQTKEFHVEIIFSFITHTQEIQKQLRRNKLMGWNMFRISKIVGPVNLIEMRNSELFVCFLALNYANSKYGLELVGELVNWKGCHIFLR